VSIGQQTRFAEDSSFHPKDPSSPNIWIRKLVTVQKIWTNYPMKMNAENHRKGQQLFVCPYSISQWALIFSNNFGVKAAGSEADHSADQPIPQ